MIVVPAMPVTYDKYDYTLCTDDSSALSLLYFQTLALVWLKMSNVMFKTSDHGEFCLRINAKVAKEDWDRKDVSIFVTASENNVSFASTTLKILSPFYCEVTKDLEKDKDCGCIFILPDFESSTVLHLLDLVSKGSTGKITGNVDEITKDIIALADALEINMLANTLNSDLEKTPMIKLRDILELKSQNQGENVHYNVDSSKEPSSSEEEEEVPDVLVCSDCGLGYYPEESLSHKGGICKKKMFQSKHTNKSREEDITRVLRCGPCGGLNFKTVLDRKRHMYNVHGFSYDCKNCDAIFSTFRSLDAHIKLVHGPRPFKCELSGCGVFFSSKSDLFLHQHLHYRQMKTEDAQSAKYTVQQQSLATFSEVQE